MRPLIAAALFVTLAVGCGPPSRDNAVETTARKICKRAEECDTLDRDYGSYGECRAEWEDNFYDGWSEAACGDGQIDPKQLDECHTQIETYDCDSNGWQAVGILLGSCSANQVCSN